MDPTIVSLHCHDVSSSNFSYKMAFKSESVHALHHVQETNHILWHQDVAFLTLEYQQQPLLLE